MNNKLLIATVTSIAISGCATDSVNTFQPFQANNLNGALDSGFLEQKINTVYIINDSSSSMSDAYTGEGFPGQTGPSKFSVEKELINRLNQTIPNITLSSGLRSFGYGPCLSWGFTELNQAIQSHSTAAFNNAISSMACSSGGTPVGTAFEAASEDLASASGNISMILLSDGSNFDISPESAIYALKEQYGDKFCLSTIWIGNEAEQNGQAVLEGLSSITGCGVSTTAGALASSSGMGNFVKDVFFNSATPTVAAIGDADNDGIPDNQDRCPNTPAGAKVDRDGCWAFHGVFFDFNKATIKAAYTNTFDNAIKILQLNPSLTVEIQGHTDSIGSEDYNLDLSEKRAESVKQLLVDSGISSSRITTKGFGESKPVASNQTDEGRAHNRRVFYKRTDI